MVSDLCVHGVYQIAKKLSVLIMEVFVCMTTLWYNMHMTGLD